jgi:hypothetical protein
MRGDDELEHPAITAAILRANIATLHEHNRDIAPPPGFFEERSIAHIHLLYLKPAAGYLDPHFSAKQNAPDSVRVLGRLLISPPPSAAQEQDYCRTRNSYMALTCHY